LCRLEEFAEDVIDKGEEVLARADLGERSLVVTYAFEDAEVGDLAARVTVSK
jgi:hypothetical protein